MFKNKRLLAPALIFFLVISNFGGVLFAEENKFLKFDIFGVNIFGRIKCVKMKDKFCFPEDDEKCWSDRDKLTECWSDYNTALRKKAKRMLIERLGTSRYCFLGPISCLCASGCEMCIDVQGEPYKFGYYLNSETEGSALLLYKVDFAETCSSDGSTNNLSHVCKQKYDEFCDDKYTGRKISIEKSKFYPISENFPNIVFGKTTREQIIKQFGRPQYQDSEKIIYVTERNRKKERSCEYKVNKGEYAGFTLEFIFDGKSKLIGVEVADGGGEC